MHHRAGLRLVYSTTIRNIKYKPRHAARGRPPTPGRVRKSPSLDSRNGKYTMSTSLITQLSAHTACTRCTLQERAACQRSPSLSQMSVQSRDLQCSKASSHKSYSTQPPASACGGCGCGCPLGLGAGLSAPLTHSHTAQSGSNLLDTLEDSDAEELMDIQEAVSRRASKPCRLVVPFDLWEHECWRVDTW